jgi:hypothetical protein
VTRARQVWEEAGKGDLFDYRTPPDDVNRFQGEQQAMAAEWLAKQAAE